MSVLESRNKYSGFFLKQVGVFLILMLVLCGAYVILDHGIRVLREEEKYNSEYTSKNEFVKTIDCAPIIDQYGLENGYLLEFEIKANVPGNVLVYFQNGSGAKYSYNEMIEVSKEYKKYELLIYPTLSNDNMEESCISFYGTYGTGVIPTVRRISLQPLTE